MDNMNTNVGCKGLKIGPDLHPNIVHFHVVILTPSSREKIQIPRKTKSIIQKIIRLRWLKCMCSDVPGLI